MLFEQLAEMLLILIADHLRDLIDLKVRDPHQLLSLIHISAAEDGYQELLIGTLTPEQLAEKLQAAYEEGQQ